MNKIIVCEIDDYPKGKDLILPFLHKCYQTNSNFSINLFCVPEWMRDDDWKILKDCPYIIPCIHGYRHDRGEWNDKSKIKNHKDELKKIIESGHPWSDIIKAPHYGYDSRFLEAAESFNFKIAVRSPMDLNGYSYIGKVWAKHNRSENTIFCYAHPTNSPKLETTRIQKRWLKEISQPNITFKTSSDVAETFYHGAYLCCGGHILNENWDYYDLNPKRPDIQKWALGDDLPQQKYAKILVQHGLMYALEKDYLNIFSAIYNSLIVGGLFIIKEDNPEKHKYHGAKSYIFYEKMIELLKKSGFGIISSPTSRLLKRYEHLFNRHKKTLRGNHYICVGVKNE